MLLTGSVGDVRILTNEQRPFDTSVMYRKKDTTVSKQQKGTFRTSLIGDNGSFNNLREQKWSSLRIPKDSERSSILNAKKTLSVNGGINFSSAPSKPPPSTQTQITKEVWEIHFYIHLFILSVSFQCEFLHTMYRAIHVTVRYDSLPTLFVEGLRILILSFEKGKNMQFASKYRICSVVMVTKNWWQRKWEKKIIRKV